jgi:two-component system LytT family response regulator
MNCIIVDDNILALKATEQLVGKATFLKLSGSFTDPSAALSFVAENKIDLIFLDVEMPEINGIEFIKSLCNPHPIIILTTTHKDYALEAFEFSVMDYLVKPIVPSRFINAVTKAKEIFQNRPLDSAESETAFIKRGNSIVRINKADINWIESLGDYVTFNTENGKYIVHSTMNDIMGKISSKDFIRVHRSYIIRISKIDNIEDDLIQYGSHLIPIGKTYRQEVYQRLNLI